MCTKNQPEKLLTEHATRVREGKLRSWENYHETVSVILSVSRENVVNRVIHRNGLEIDSSESDSNESNPNGLWTIVGSKSKSILKKRKKPK